MKLTRSYIASFLSFPLVFVFFLGFVAQSATAQDSKVALQRGYRTGYSDGYMSGYRDAIDNQAKNYQRHGEFAKADRAYNKDYGTLEDYRDGYQQGFESGYNTGFEKRSFDAAIPAEIRKRGVKTPVLTTTSETTIVESAPEKTVTETVTTNTVTNDAGNQTNNTSDGAPQNQSSEVAPTETVNGNSENSQIPVITNKPEYTGSAPSGSEPVVIPVETEFIVELVDGIGTERSLEGDKFQARVISPNEMNGAIVEGRVSKIQKPGRIKRRAEVLLSFDRIVLSENRWSNFNAILTEVLPLKGDNVKRVDPEGTVEGKSSVKGDSAKVGAATGTGIVIGAIAGGPVGAAVGAGVGAAFGVGAVVVERGKHIKLNKNQQLRIKTSYETQIR
ncbi:MAG: hypothetical protein WKF71_07375 [Pyrinomonadaceae bacterium]|jgi:hypothetical protein